MIYGLCCGSHKRKGSLAINWQLDQRMAVIRYWMNRKDYRKFIRHLRASDMAPFLRTGCDMGWYGHFKGHVKTDSKKLSKARKRMLEEIKKMT